MKGIIYRNLYDIDGAIISLDGNTLYKVPDVERYRVPEGVEIIDIKAFKDRPNLKEIDIPYTVEWFTDNLMSNDAMIYAPEGLKVNYWNWPYPENCIRSAELMEEIANGNSVTIQGFGSFEPREKASRRIYNPTSKTYLVVPSKTTLSYKMSVALKTQLNKE